MFWLVILYLGAAVGANIAIAHFGPSASIITAFVCIGLNITTRDRIHDKWSGDYQLWLRMGVLIATGGILSYLAAPGTSRIAIASMVTFMFSETVDATTYAAFEHKRWIIRSNASNVAGAFVDSMIFPTLAFGLWLPWIIVGQFLAKTLGGFLWSLILRRRRTIYVVDSIYD